MYIQHARMSNPTCSYPVVFIASEQEKYVSMHNNTVESPDTEHYARDDRTMSAKYLRNPLGSKSRNFVVNSVAVAAGQP
jgi:hypothetical protein